MTSLLSGEAQLTAESIKAKIIDFLSVGDCIKTLISSSMAISLYYVANILLTSINFRYMGIQGDEYTLPAVGLGNTWITGTNYALIWGLNIGTLALCSQAFGAKEFKLSGKYFHRALAMRGILFIPCYALLYFSESIFLAWKVNPTIASHASLYCRMQFLPLLCMYITDTLKSLLLSAGIFNPLLAIQIIMTVFHLLACHFLTVVFGLGMYGVCYAQILSYSLSLTLTLLYVKWKRPCEESLFWPDELNMTDILKQFKQEIPIGILYYLDVMGFDIDIMFAGQYPAVELGAQVITLNIIIMNFMPLFGMVVNLTSISGNAMGEGNPKKAIRFRNAGIIYACTSFLIQVTLMSVFRESIIGLFTNHTETATKAASLLRIYAFFMLPDFTQGTTTSVLRGVGKETFACKLYIISFYAIGAPLSYLFGSAFGWYAKGLWVGMGSSISLIALVSAWKLLSLDLYQQSREIVERIKVDKNQIESKDNYIEMSEYKA